MEGSKRLRDRASRYAKTAIKLEEENQMKNAALYYSRAVKTLSKMLELHPPSNLKAIYENRIHSYKEKIKEIVTTLETKGKKEKGPQEDRLDEGIIVEKTDIGWDDIGNLEDAKEGLKEASVWPIKRPDLFTGARRPWHGILLFGPPGCGKTLLAKAVANNVEATFFNIDSAILLSKWFGESEKRIKELFKEARKKRPSIIYVDEVESLASERKDTEHEAMNRVKTVFLSQMDGLNTSNESVIVIGSTNLPEKIDMAFRRRFERRIYVPPPNEAARKKILRIHLRSTDIAKDVDLDHIAKRTEGFSGHDLELLVREAAMEPVRELANKQLLFKENAEIRKVTMHDFKMALEKRKPSLDRQERYKYRRWAEKFAN